MTGPLTTQRHSKQSRYSERPNMEEGRAHREFGDRRTKTGGKSSAEATRSGSLEGVSGTVCCRPTVGRNTSPSKALTRGVWKRRPRSTWPRRGMVTTRTRRAMDLLRLRTTVMKHGTQDEQTARSFRRLGELTQAFELAGVVMLCVAAEERGRERGWNSSQRGVARAVRIQNRPRIVVGR